MPERRRKRNQLQQVMLNLLINGCDAMTGPDADLRLSVQTRVTERGGVEVSIADRGLGIPAADLERIFEPFFRLPGASERVGGVGLGLSLVQSIAKRHGGRVQCTDRLGGGACFEVSLPQSKTANT